MDGEKGPSCGPRGWEAAAARANLGSALGTVWQTLGAPNSPLLLLFLSECLHAEKWYLGLLLALTNLGPILEPLGAWLVDRWRCRKAIFLCGFLANRLPFFLLVWLPWWKPGRHQTALVAVLGMVAITRIGAHLAAPAWWSWMGDLVPAHHRPRWLSRRVRAAAAVTSVTFILASLLLHLWVGSQSAVLLSALFAVGAVCGTLDILIYLAVPEIEMAGPKRRLGWRRFCRRVAVPFRDCNFRRFLLGLALWSLAVNLALPFVPLYVRGETIQGQPIGLGGSWLYLALLTVATNLGSLLAGRWWGRWSTRTGACRLLVVGSLYFYCHLIFWFAQPGGISVPVVLTTLGSGMLLAAWTLGQNQLLLELTPARRRGFFVAAFNLCVGVGTAGGTFLGGWIANALPHVPWKLPTGQPWTYLHLQLLLGGVLGLAALLLLRGVRCRRPKVVRSVLEWTAAPRPATPSTQAVTPASASGRMPLGELATARQLATR